MPRSRFVPEYEIRSAFSEAMSRMYRGEVPLYGDLLAIVDDVNARVLNANPRLAEELTRSGELDRLGQERHGAIRLGTPAELSMMRRVLAVMGLHPVGYYDLSVAGVPVHSTAFRPIDPDSLHRNAFRLFTSLLRLELIQDETVRKEAERLLARRRIFSDEAVALVAQFERDGGLDADAAEAFVGAVLETFRWHSEALVGPETYAKLRAEHRLVADVVSFKGPHINHLTPRTLDIDAAQREMEARNIGAKSFIEGPPVRNAPILLRQTSFKALEEPIRLRENRAEVHGTHTARFGEIEQRGAALTPKGRELYDTLLAEVREIECSAPSEYARRLSKVFQRFPDHPDALRREGLAYHVYRLVNPPPVGCDPPFDLDALIASGIVEATALLYEDFLPVSAAGIFQSNLGGGDEQGVFSAADAQAAFEEALGARVADPFALYEAIERSSIDAVKAALSPSTARQDVAPP